MSRFVKRIIGSGVTLAAFAVLAWWLARLPAVQDAVLRRAVDRALAATRIDLLGPDALRVVLCGTGNPLADRSRADACTAVFAGGSLYLVDAGPGAWKNLALWHLPAPRLAAVMLTHSRTTTPITSETLARSICRPGRWAAGTHCASLARQVSSRLWRDSRRPTHWTRATVSRITAPR